MRLDVSRKIAWAYEPSDMDGLCNKSDLRSCVSPNRSIKECKLSLLTGHDQLVAQDDLKFMVALSSRFKSVPA